MKTSPQMNMATRLMADSLASLDTLEVARSLGGAADAIIRLCEDLKGEKEGTLRSIIEGYGLPPSSRLDAYTVPDAVWMAICLKQPYLYCYPLGEITERTAKKTVISLILQPKADGAGTGMRRPTKKELSLNETETENSLRRAINSKGLDGLLELFFSHYFFEMSIDYLRRPTGDLEFDLSYWYNFSTVGLLVSLGAEWSLRTTLAEQCEERAKDFVPLVRDWIGKDDPGQMEEKIAIGLKHLFKAGIRGPWPALKQEKPFLNVIVGTKKPGSIKKKYQVDEKTLRLQVEGEHSNISFSLDRVEQFLNSLREEKEAQPVHPLVKDLLDLGIAVYMSDRYTKRAHHLGRQIGILMQVRRPAVWSKAQFAVERTASFLARDDFSVHFTKLTEPNAPDRQLPRQNDDKRCVCLLSGGIDSVVGAIWALEKGWKPIFVSHYASTRLAGTQKKVVMHLEHIFGTKLEHIGIYVNRARGKGVDLELGAAPRSLVMQHLRTFLFLSLATAVALELGIRKVFIFENGPVALNPLFSEARINTRTAHAHFLVFFRQLIKTVFKTDLEIENPFAYDTKGEVTRVLADKKYKGLIAETESCWFTFRVGLRASHARMPFSGRHDGDCFPCILRRTAVHYSGLWDEDANYLVNVFCEFPELSRATTTGIADFLRFCKNTLVLSNSKLLLYAPDFSVCAEDVDPQKLIKMYRRHSKEVIACFQERSSDRFRRTFAPILGT